jgi:G6PDH family F420-dependent oxidoreductase
MQIGFKLMAEAYPPHELVRQAERAEAAGFDFVEISDHYHPWLYSQGHSPFVWSVLAAIAMRTERIELATGVTCPSFRYHPAIIAQAAATTQILADGRFVLGVGSGERLSEHVTGAAWPDVDVRQARLREALEVIRLLWSGGYQSYAGHHFTLSDARVFDLPETLPPIAVAAGGQRAAALAAELGDGLFATDPDAELVTAYADAGGSGPKYCEVPLAYADDADTAAASARKRFRFGALGWKVMAELPNPINFEAATRHVRDSDMAASFACGPDPDRHVEVFTEFVDAGFDRLALLSAGPDVDAFIDFFTSELREKLTALG